MLSPGIGARGAPGFLANELPTAAQEPRGPPGAGTYLGRRTRQRNRRGRRRLAGRLRARGGRGDGGRGGGITSRPCSQFEPGSPPLPPSGGAGGGDSAGRLPAMPRLPVPAPGTPPGRDEPCPPSHAIKRARYSAWVSPGCCTGRGSGIGKGSPTAIASSFRGYTSGPGTCRPTPARRTPRSPGSPP